MTGVCLLVFVDVSMYVVLYEDVDVYYEYESGGFVFLAAYVQDKMNNVGDTHSYNNAKP